ncbi:hypothetical protein ACOMHN_015598 [Nucella lapillus]
MGDVGQGRRHIKMASIKSSREGKPSSYRAVLEGQFQSIIGISGKMKVAGPPMPGKLYTFSSSTSHLASWEGIRQGRGVQGMETVISAPLTHYPSLEKIPSLDC